VTQQAVERALGKLLTDENFRERFFENPEGPAGKPASPSRRSSSRRSRACLDTRSSAFTTISTSGSVGLLSILIADLARAIAAISGRIREIAVGESDCVEAGQVIATLDDRRKFAGARLRQP